MTEILFIFLVSLTFAQEVSPTRPLNNSRKFICNIKSVPTISPQDLIALKNYIGCETPQEEQENE